MSSCIQINRQQKIFADHFKHSQMQIAMGTVHRRYFLPSPCLWPRYQSKTKIPTIARGMRTKAAMVAGGDSGFGFFPGLDVVYAPDGGYLCADYGSGCGG